MLEPFMRNYYRVIIYLESSQNQIYQIVKHYSNKSYRMATFYFNRALLMLPYAEKKDVCTYDCTCNVVALFENLLKQQFSVQRTVVCRSCGHERLENYRVLTVAPTVSNNLLERNSYENFIEKCIYSTLQE